MQTNLIDQGLNLMLYGMGTVFTFLTLLVFATTLMSSLIKRFAPVAEQADPHSAPRANAQAAEPVNQPVNQSVNQPVNPQIVEAIRQAIAQHRQI